MKNSRGFIEGRARAGPLLQCEGAETVWDGIRRASIGLIEIVLDPLLLLFQSGVFDQDSTSAQRRESAQSFIPKSPCSRKSSSALSPFSLYLPSSSRSSRRTSKLSGVRTSRLN